MTDGVLFALSLVAALGCGLVAGVFFAFSAFVMKALGRLPTDRGIAAMQSLNTTVLNAWFLGVFVGTALLSAVLVVASFVWWRSESGSTWLVVGGLLYVIGSFGLTRVVHLPRNAALGAVSPEGEESALFWIRYMREWTAWNHVRLVCSLAASAAFVVASASR